MQNITNQFRDAVYNFFDAYYLVEAKYAGPVELGVSAFEKMEDNEWAIDALSQLTCMPIDYQTPLEELDNMLNSLGDIVLVDNINAADNVAVATTTEDQTLYLTNLI